VRHFGDVGFDDDYDDGAGDDDDDNSWSDLGDLGDIGPEESASRSHDRLPRSRSHPPPVRDPPRQQARGPYQTVVDPPPGPPPGRRGARSRERRQQRPRSDILDDEGFPYGRPGQLPYHPTGEWGGIGLGGYGPGHAHTVLSGYVNPVEARTAANLSSDPFVAPYRGGNPFSDDYTRRGNRNSMPLPPPNTDLMAFGPGYGAAYPPYGGFPPYGPWGYGYPPGPAQQPPAPPASGSNKSTPAPKEEAPPPEDPRVKRIEELLLDQRKRELEKQMAEAKAKLDAKRAAEEDKLAALHLLITKNNEAQLEREKKAEEKAKKVEDEKKAAADASEAAKKAAAEKEKALKEAAQKAKEEVEAEAKKKMDELEEKKKEAEAEAKKKLDELEQKRKALEEENKKLKPGDDMLKAPIRFKDAVGRKFSFPWHLCKTWKVCVSFDSTLGQC